MTAAQGKGSSGLRGMVPLGTVAPRRNTARIAAGVLVLVLSMLGGVIAYQRVGDRKEVLIVLESVEPGEPIPASAIGTVRVAADTEVQTVNANALNDVLTNFTAGVQLVPGSLLTPGMLSGGDTFVIAEGAARMGIVVSPGRVPLVVSAGQKVKIFALSDASAEVNPLDDGVAFDVEVTVISSRRIISSAAGGSGSSSAPSTGTGAAALFEDHQIDVVTTQEDARRLARYVAEGQILMVTIREAQTTTTTAPAGEDGEP